MALQTQPSIGTTVTAYLPTAAHSRPETTASQKRIAIIDDDDGVRTALEKTLVRRGYEVVSIDSGEQALERIEELSQCDLLVLDQQMNGMNGLETYRALRKKLRTLPVCFVSGYKLPPEICNLVRVDKKCEAVLKPFTSKVIDETMKNLLGN
jgi:CheY-like chemotaxis protein